MWFKNLIVFRLPRNWEVSADALAERLQPQAFAPVSGLAEGSVGWAPPREDDVRLVHPVGRQMLLALRHYHVRAKLAGLPAYTEFYQPDHAAEGLERFRGSPRKHQRSDYQ